jgi:hypothetical protein
VSTEVTIRPSGWPSWSTIALRAGATPGSVPDSKSPGPSSCSLRALRRGVQARLDPIGILVRDRLAQPVVGDDLAPGGVRAGGGVAIEVRGDPLRLGQLGVGLALLRARDDLEQHQRHRDHRDHDDDQEEQPEPVAEGRRDEVAKAHGSGGADRNLAAHGFARAWLPGYNRRFTAPARNPAAGLAGL